MYQFFLLVFIIIFWRYEKIYSIYPYVDNTQYVYSSKSKYTSAPRLHRRRSCESTCSHSCPLATGRRPETWRRRKYYHSRKSSQSTRLPPSTVSSRNKDAGRRCTHEICLTRCITRPSVVYSRRSSLSDSIYYTFSCFDIYTYSC